MTLYFDQQGSAVAETNAQFKTVVISEQTQQNGGILIRNIKTTYAKQQDGSWQEMPKLKIVLDTFIQL